MVQRWKPAWLVLVVASCAFSQSSAWINKAPLPTDRDRFGIGVVNGVIYVIGGLAPAGAAPILNTVEAYDPVTDTWATKAPMPTARFHLAVGVVNGLIYAVGGEGYVGDRDVIFNTMEAYDPVTDTWATKPPMPTARTALAVGVVDDILYAVGGANPAYGLNTVEAYNPSTGVWYGRAPMNIGRESFGVGVVGRRLYAVGGGNPDPHAKDTRVTQTYDPARDSWTNLAQMPRGRLGFGVAVAGGILYAAGGLGGSGFTPTALAEVDAYDPETNVWTTPARLPFGRAFLSAAAVGGFLYALGGGHLNLALDLHLLGTRNLASYWPDVVAPDMIAFGEASGIAPKLIGATGRPWPPSLGGVSLEITDSQNQRLLAPIYFVTTNAIGYLIPDSVAPGYATARLTTFIGATITGTFTVERVAPGLFSANSTGSGVAAGLANRVAPDGAQTTSSLFDLSNRDLPVNVDLTAPGDVYLSLYGTGFRGATGSATATVAGVPVHVLDFAAVPEYPGADVVNIGPLPRTLGSGVQNIVLTFAGKVANTVTVGIR